MSDKHFYVGGLLVCLGMAACLFVSTFTSTTEWLEIPLFVGPMLFWSMFGYKCGWQHATDVLLKRGEQA